MSNRKPFHDLEFKDSFMFAAMMNDPETCRSVLERILEIPIKKVVCHSEHTILFNSDARGVRLDVYADTQEGTIYNVEMQTTDRHNLPRRSRFHQSQMDVTSLKPGADVNTLPDSIVIFICTFDPCEHGLYRYTFQNHCSEDGTPLGDGTCKIFLNTKGTNPEEVPEELVRFLSYVDNPQHSDEETSDPLIDRLKQQLKELKQNRTMEERYMQFWEMLKEEREEGRMDLFRLMDMMEKDGRSSEIIRLRTDPMFFKDMLKFYRIED